MNTELLALLGEFPKKPDSLNIKVLKEELLQTYKRQLISYHVEENERVNAYLLQPKSTSFKNKDKNPAILAIHQHAEQFYIGKSEVVGAQKQTRGFDYGRKLAERGYTVIVPDQLAFEERRPAQWQAVDNVSLGDGSYEKLLYFKYLLNGSTLQAKYLSDLSCAIDLLCSLESVDQNRIGAIGHSLGGQETIWMMIYDSRVKVGVSSCGVSTYRSILEDNISHNYSFYIPNLMQLGDMNVFMQEIAPKPMFISSGDKDFYFPIRGIHQIDESLSQTYQKLGLESNYCSIIFNGKHDFPEWIQEKAYTWFNQHL